MVRIHHRDTEDTKNILLGIIPIAVNKYIIIILNIPQKFGRGEA